MNDINIALDIDDVLAGYVIGVHKAFDAGLKRHNHWSKDESTGLLILNRDVSDGVYTQKYLDKCEHNEDFWYNLPIINVPNSIKFNVSCYITSSPENMVHVRESWLKRHFFPNAPVIHSKNKDETMNNLNIDLLIDDRLDTVRRVNESCYRIRAVHYKPYYSTLEHDSSIKSLLDVK